MGQKSSPFKLKAMPLETFPGHKINRNSFVIEGNNIVLKSPPDKSDQPSGEKLGVVSSTKSDKNEFNSKQSSQPTIPALASFPGKSNKFYLSLFLKVL